MTPSELRAGHIKMLKWAIWLCQAKLESLRDGDWINLKQDLNDFVYSGSFHRDQVGKKNHGGWLDKIPSKETVADLQVRLRESFQEIVRADSGRSGTFGSIFGPGTPIQLPLKGVQYLVGWPDLPFRHAFQEDHPKDRLHNALTNHFVWSGVTGSQVRTCPECNRIFLMDRKPRQDKKFYCSLRCSRLAATHRFRETHKEELKLKEQERSRLRYEEKVRQKYPKAKVAGRARKAKGV